MKHKKKIERLRRRQEAYEQKFGKSKRGGNPHGRVTKPGSLSK